MVEALISYIALLVIVAAHIAWDEAVDTDDSDVSVPIPGQHVMGAFAKGPVQQV